MKQRQLLAQDNKKETTATTQTSRENLLDDCLVSARRIHEAYKCFCSF